MSFTLQFKSTEELIHYGYYQAYPYIVHELITKNKVNVSWENPSKSKCTVLNEVVEEHFKRGTFKIKSLVESINHIGMIFPFIGRSSQVTLGKHRWYALRAMQVDKEFLTLLFRYENGELINSTSSFLFLPIVNIKEKKITWYETNDVNIIRSGFFTFSDAIGCEISLIKKIKPHKWVNNKVDYEEFISTPIEKFDIFKKI